MTYDEQYKRCPNCGKVYPPCEGNCESMDMRVDRMIFSARMWATERERSKNVTHQLIVQRTDTNQAYMASEQGTTYTLVQPEDARTDHYNDSNYDQDRSVLGTLTIEDYDVDAVGITSITYKGVAGYVLVSADSKNAKFNGPRGEWITLRLDPLPV